MLPGLALIPLGLGTGVPAMTTAVLASVDKARAGVATACSTLHDKQLVRWA
jgi:MFS transporter, DHA2 family, methylenomycin A resistance protein